MSKRARQPEDDEDPYEIGPARRRQRRRRGPPQGDFTPEEWEGFLRHVPIMNQAFQNRTVRVVPVSAIYVSDTDLSLAEIGLFTVDRLCSVTSIPLVGRNTWLQKGHTIASYAAYAAFYYAVFTYVRTSVDDPDIMHGVNRMLARMTEGRHGISEAWYPYVAGVIGGLGAATVGAVQKVTKIGSSGNEAVKSSVEQGGCQNLYNFLLLSHFGDQCDQMATAGQCKERYLQNVQKNKRMANLFGQYYSMYDDVKKLIERIESGRRESTEYLRNAWLRIIREVKGAKGEFGLLLAMFYSQWSGSSRNQRILQTQIVHPLLEDLFKVDKDTYETVIKTCIIVMLLGTEEMYTRFFTDCIYPLPDDPDYLAKLEIQNAAFNQIMGEIQAHVPGFKIPDSYRWRSDYPWTDIYVWIKKENYKSPEELAELISTHSARSDWYTERTTRFEKAYPFAYQIQHVADAEDFQEFIYMMILLLDKEEDEIDNEVLIRSLLTEVTETSRVIISGDESSDVKENQLDLLMQQINKYIHVRQYLAAYLKEKSGRDWDMEYERKYLEETLQSELVPYDYRPHIIKLRQVLQGTLGVVLV